jgi:hypothetical protein
MKKSPNISPSQDAAGDASKSHEEKKRKLINDIRCLLNDYPMLHPLADDFFHSSTLTLLKKIHLDLLKLDGSKPQKEMRLREKLEKGKKMSTAPLRALKKSAPRKIQNQEEFEICLPS